LGAIIAPGWRQLHSSSAALPAPSGGPSNADLGWRVPLEDLGADAHVLFPVDAPRVVGVEIGRAHHREDLAGVRVHHHHRAALGAVLGNGRAQFLLGDGPYALRPSRSLF